jgi:signal transduction histidine kinase
MTRIRRAQKHLLALINDILNFARIEAGRLELQLEVVEIDRVIAELTPLVEPQLQAKGLQYRIEGGPAGTAAHADSERLTQVLLNLLDNAVKYGPLDQRVLVNAERLTRTLRIEVSDRGPGIPAEHADQIWEPYQRLARDANSAVGGSGIGLAVVHDLARLHDGRAWVEANPGGGARFVVELGLGQLPAQATAPREADAETVREPA